MMLELTLAETGSIPYVLPVQGSIKTLELVTSIVEKINVKSKEAVSSDDAVAIEFEDDEIELMKLSIHALDEAQRLPLQALSLAKKILRRN